MVSSLVQGPQKLRTQKSKSAGFDTGMESKVLRLFGAQHKEVMSDPADRAEVLKGIPLLLFLDEPMPALDVFLSACAATCR